MEYSVYKANGEDLPDVVRIYAYAQAFMAEHGNPGQWGTSYPSEELLRQDMARGNLYLIAQENKIHGVFYFAIEEDSTYQKIYDGAWNRDEKYGVIHRIAGDGSGGILRTAVMYALQKTDYLRIDTHQDNYVMQRALEKLGFTQCGTIYIGDGSPRIAYDRVQN